MRRGKCDRVRSVLPGLITLPLVLAMNQSPAAYPLLIDDFARGDGRSLLGTNWRLVTDRVMGGLSEARMTVVDTQGRRALCLSGDVSLDNNGGFVQVNLALAPDGDRDASAYTGVRLVVRGNGEDYKVHLKTPDTALPWQSYRADFRAGDDWHEVRLPFSAFSTHRLDAPLDIRRLRRLGIVAIGRAMHADLCVAELGFY